MMPRSRLHDLIDLVVATRLTRRGTLAASGAALFGALRGELARAANHRAADVAASAPPPIPAPGFDHWPACSGEREHYCIETFTVDGTDELLLPEPEYVPFVWGSSSVPEGSVADRLEWDIRRAQGDLQPEDLTKEMVLRIRSGLLEPVVTTMWSAGVRLVKSGDAGSGWNVAVRGRPTNVPSFLTNPEQEQADLVFRHFQGMGLDRQSPILNQGFNGFEGYVAGANVRGLGFPQWLGNGWSVGLQSSHLMPDGSVTHGSYVAWIAPQALQYLELTAEQAAAGQLLITRTDGGETSPIDAALSVLDGGVFVEISDVTFSSPTISMVRRNGGACAQKCHKGQVCKNGRCVKKKKHHKKRHH